MAEIKVYNLTSQSWMRLDKDAVLEAIHDSSSTKLIFDYSIGEERLLSSRDLRKAAYGKNAEDLIYDHKACSNILIDSKNIREALGKTE